jgi:hypothetical protein
MIEMRIREKLAQYPPQAAFEQEYMLRELMQQYLLLGLKRSGFFEHAAFHGGTFLRLIHGLPRFSEDLDFILKQADENFRWDPHLSAIYETCEKEGIKIEFTDRSKADVAVKKVFAKTDSLGGVVSLALPYERQRSTKIKIRLEVDIRPPPGSVFESAFVDFPVPISITVQDLPSSFASKSHALLCRNYLKGRDWFDFVWYLRRRVSPNFALLSSAIDQAGPWQGKRVSVTKKWYVKQLEEKICSIDWRQAKQDVERFLWAKDLDSLDVWGQDYFLHLLDSLSEEQQGNA